MWAIDGFLCPVLRLDGRFVAAIGAVWIFGTLRRCVGEAGLCIGGLRILAGQETFRLGQAEAPRCLRQMNLGWALLLGLELILSFRRIWACLILLSLFLGSLLTCWEGFILGKVWVI